MSSWHNFFVNYLWSHQALTAKITTEITNTNVAGVLFTVTLNVAFEDIKLELIHGRGKVNLVHTLRLWKKIHAFQSGSFFSLLAAAYKFQTNPT